MIDSILQRHTDHVHFQNISTPNEIITELHLIQEHIQRHYENWTQLNQYDTQSWTSWKDEYKPKENILSEWYDSALQNISLEELKNSKLDSFYAVNLGCLSKK